MAGRRSPAGAARQRARRRGEGLPRDGAPAGKIVARHPSAEVPVKYVLFYESADDVSSKAPPHFPAHRARLDDFHARGTLLMVGTFANPQEEGSMAVFTTREAAEEFATDDPFVLNGVVREWHIRGWNEVLAESLDGPRSETA
jgi:uncharacterized protein YciI